MSRIPATNEVSIPSHPHILAEFRKAVAPTTDQSSPGVCLFLSKIHLIADTFPQDPQAFGARYGRIIYAAEIETDLRVVFYIEGTTVVTVEIGSHAVYRG